MAAGFTYNLTPVDEKEERYDVQSGVRRRGPYVLDTTGLTVGSYLPSFTPIYADLKKKKAFVVKNVKVVSEVGATDTTIQIAKNSLAFSGMKIGTGSKGAAVTAIDQSNAGYDALTIDAAIGAVAVGTILFEASAADGKAPKNTANSALYGAVKVESGIVIVALLMKAFEIEPDKLILPFSANDEANMPYFQFNE